MKTQQAAKAVKKEFPKFETMLDAWNYARQHGLRRSPKRLNLREWTL
jgi:hypothetical protein